MAGQVGVHGQGRPRGEEAPQPPGHTHTRGQAWDDKGRPLGPRGPELAPAGGAVVPVVEAEVCGAVLVGWGPPVAVVGVVWAPEPGKPGNMPAVGMLEGMVPPCDITSTGQHTGHRYEKLSRNLEYFIMVFTLLIYTDITLSNLALGYTGCLPCCAGWPLIAAAVAICTMFCRKWGGNIGGAPTGGAPWGVGPEPLPLLVVEVVLLLWV